MNLNDLLKLVEQHDDLAICFYKSIAEHQRKEELLQGLGLDGTVGFEEKGCYDCDGFRFNERVCNRFDIDSRVAYCSAYVSLASMTVGHLNDRYKKNE